MEWVEQMSGLGEEDCGDDSNCDTQHQRGGIGCMVNSRSWVEELQDVFTPQAEEEEDCYSGERTRLSSISVSDLSLSLSVWATQALKYSLVCPNFF